MIPPRPAKDGPSHLDDVADEDAWLRSVFREEELEAPGQQRGPSSEQSDAAQDVDMDPKQRTTEDALDIAMENVRSSCQGSKGAVEPSGQTVSLSDNPCEDGNPIPARRTDWYLMWDKDDPTELVDARLAKFKGLPASAYNSSDVMDLLADALDLLPDEHRARGIAALQVVTRHHLYLVEARTKAESASPTAGARVGPAHEAPSSVLAPPCPTARAAASASNEAPSSVLAITSRGRSWPSRLQLAAASDNELPAKAKAKAKTPPGPVRAALEKAKKSTKRSCVIELRSDDVDAPEMNASAFMGFRNLILGLLGSKIVVNSTFPLKGGLGLVLSDDTQAGACVEALNRAKGYTAKVRSGLWPRIILFNPAVNRGVTIDHVDRMIRETNPDLVKDIGGTSSSSSSTVNPPATSLVSTIYWRGQREYYR
ncbi:hypothetical protein FOZ60_012240 [Perkinsus olseni]|uniref:Uncharacterized protein n=1 Tax=Perkinsus olseni TaxID=32597 RepID=A0A7J6NEH3_PEROL|nr:hypothetical protein FOZ60_012240 [Perkinsus olseni]